MLDVAPLVGELTFEHKVHNQGKEATIKKEKSGNRGSRSKYVERVLGRQVRAICRRW